MGRPHPESARCRPSSSSGPARATRTPSDPWQGRASIVVMPLPTGSCVIHIEPRCDPAGVARGVARPAQPSRTRSFRRLAPPSRGQRLLCRGPRRATLGGPRSGVATRHAGRSRRGRRPSLTETSSRMPSAGCHLNTGLVVVLHHHLGYPLTEIAETLGIPVGTARSRLHYAIRQLRTVLDAGNALSRHPESDPHDPIQRSRSRLRSTRRGLARGRSEQRTWPGPRDGPGCRSLRPSRANRTPATEAWTDDAYA